MACPLGVHINRVPLYLTLSLPECLRGFCKVTLDRLLSLWRKSYDVTIQMRALCLYFHMMPFVSQNFRKWNLELWSKFAFGHIWHERVNGIWGGSLELKPSYVSLESFECNYPSYLLIMSVLLKSYVHINREPGKLGRKRDLLWRREILYR